MPAALPGAHCTGGWVLNFQIFWIVRHQLYQPKLVQVIFCYFSYTWAVQLMRGVFHLGISFIPWFRVIRAIFCAFVADKVDGVVDKGSRDTISHDVQTLLEACFIDKAFPGENKTYSPGTALLNHCIRRFSKFLGVR